MIQEEYNSIKYTLHDYIELHKAVIEYQNDNNKKSAEFIINKFEDFIWKYVNLICYGNIKIDDTFIRCFVSLYSSKKDTKTPHRKDFNFKNNFKNRLLDTVSKIQNIYSSYTETDIKNELICSLLVMAKGYKDYFKPSFHTYVQKCFHFQAFRNLINLTDDIISRLDYEDIYSVEGSVCMDTNLIVQTNLDTEIDKQLSLKNSLLPIIDDKHSVFNVDTLNTNWVNGVTCTDIFNILTPFEREILIQYNIHNMTDTEIANRHNLSRGNVNQKRLKAVSKLRAVLHI